MFSLYTHQTKNIWKVWLFIPALFAFIFPLSIFAHDIPGAVKEYVYDTISVNIQVNKDSTFDVAEQQTYDFNGHFHKGWRSILLKDIGSITDVVVKDEAGIPLTYSAQKLDKQDPANWGKYTYYRENGAENIEWYYSATDEKKTWTIFYKVHGGISFLKDHDEIYWNLFTDYDVPVGFAEATVMLPEAVPDPKVLTSTLYSLHTYDAYTIHEATIPDGKTFHFALAPIGIKEPVTIASGWPKGMVDQGAYWKDFRNQHWALITSALIILFSILIAVLYWYVTEVKGKGRGTIIPEYAPPENLPPAMAEVLIREKLTSKAWPATIVDLAVRGFLDIEEEKAPVVPWALAFIIIPVFLFFFFMFGATMFLAVWLSIPSIGRLILVVIGAVAVTKVLMSMFKGESWRDKLISKEYRLVKKKEFEDDISLKDYEKEFLHILFPSGDTFSTKEMKSDVVRQRILFKKTQKLKEQLFREIDNIGGLYEVGLSGEKKRSVIFVLLWAVLFFVVFVGAQPILAVLGFDSALVLATIVVCGVCLFAFFKYEARLSKEGAILREEWLGFKLYLKTAERDRLQNLTPELFEKYLPYAIIFDVEKKWARAFDSLNLPPPNWYYGSAVGFVGSGHSAGANSGGFAPSAFSASFASSLSSAFGSAGGGGGASGGGGGAGGGGGGGGGGAS